MVLISYGLRLYDGVPLEHAEQRKHLPRVEVHFFEQGCKSRVLLGQPLCGKLVLADLDSAEIEEILLELVFLVEPEELPHVFVNDVLKENNQVQSDHIFGRVRGRPRSEDFVDFEPFITSADHFSVFVVLVAREDDRHFGLLDAFDDSFIKAQFIRKHVVDVFEHENRFICVCLPG